MTIYQFWTLVIYIPRFAGLDSARYKNAKNINYRNERPMADVEMIKTMTK